MRFLVVLMTLSLSIAVNAKPLKLAISPAFPEPFDRYEEVPNPNATKFDNIKNKRQHIMVLAKNSTPSRYAAWQALVEHLQKKSGIEIELQPFASRLAFELAVNKGEFDLVYLDPMQFVTFKRHPGYNAFVKRTAQPIRSMIVVRNDHAAENVKQLQGLRIAFPSPLDFGGSIVPRESLKRLEIGYQAVFKASSSEVLQAVLAGEVEAGATRIEDFKGEDLSTQQKLRTLWNTPGFTPFALAAHPRVSFFTINRLQRALVTMDNSEQGRAILADIFVENGFETAGNGDWHDVEAIDLESLNQAPSQ